MATYVYETVPQRAGERAKRFEVRQSMKDAPLTRHPDTGEPARRVISGGYGFIGAGRSESAAAPATGGGCAPGCGCHAHS